MSVFTSSNEQDYLTGIEINGIAAEKRTLLDQSVCEPKFYITIIDYEILPSFTSYVIEYGVLNSGGKFVTTNRVRTRYSKLLELYTVVQQCYKPKYLPVFPPKCWWGNNTDNLARQRMLMMNPFLKQLNQFKDVINLPQFKNIFCR